MTTPPKGLLAYFASNHVAANLLMAFFILGGIWVARDIKQEVFPASEPDEVAFSMNYPGATAEEMEEGVLMPVEDAVRGMDVVKRIEGSAYKSNAYLDMELADGVDKNRAMQDIKNAIDRITTFPDGAEQPRLRFPVRQRSTMTLALSGELDESTLSDFADSIKNDLQGYPEISQVDVRGDRDPEIVIEVPHATLQSLGLTLGDIAATIRRSARDFAGGDVRTDSGEILLRSAGRLNYASEFADIPIVTRPNGTALTLADIAEVREGFRSSQRMQWLDGAPGMYISIYQTEEEKPLEISRAVTDYVATMQDRIPEGISLRVVSDRTKDYRERLDLLARNGFIGLCLVLLILGLFLEPKLAFWVAMGIPVSLAGAIMLLPGMDMTINMVSLFAFIITLGMVVDDAVIVGENVYRKMQEGLSATEAAIQGTKEMTVPILFAVGTNIIAFIPLLLVPGSLGRFFAAIPLVVIAVFVVSLFECLFVLPAHLAHAGLDSPRKGGLLAALNWLEHRTGSAFERFTENVYGPLLRASVRARYLATALFVAALLVIGAWYQSGRIDFRFFPRVESNRMDAEITIPFGAPFKETVRISRLVEAAGLRAVERMGGKKMVNSWNVEAGYDGTNTGEVTINLVSQAERGFSGQEFVNTWREEVGPLAGLESLFFEFELGPGGSRGLTVELSHPDRLTLEAAAADLAGRLGNFEGVTDIDDGFASGKPQIDFTLTPEAHALGLTLDELGRQIRHAYYGAEALRQQRGSKEIKVMVRLPERERRSHQELENMIIFTPSGGQIPLVRAAEMKHTQAFTSIRRVDAQRVLRISANVNPALANAKKIRSELENGELDDLVAGYPGLTHRFGGRQRGEDEAMRNLMAGLAVSLTLIFALLAALFRSYLQGLIVMACVPFAIGAALLGHVIMGYDLSAISVFGIIATCGVVVNGALVYTVTLNQMGRDGMPFDDAVIQAGLRRFRPIMLTSLTTFFGLAPMIFETSLQARFLVPMAIALGFGILISSVVILVMIPCVHRIVMDGKRVFSGAESGAPIEGAHEAR